MNGDVGALVLSVSVLLTLVLGAAAGSVLRSIVLSRVYVAPRRRERLLGTAWVNVPASALAAFVLVLQQRLELLPGSAAPGWVLLAVLLLGVSGGLSTWSALALEVARAVLAGRRAELLAQGVGVATGLVAALAGAGLATVLLTVLG